MGLFYKDSNGNISRVGNGENSQVATLPSPSASIVGTVYQYIGTTDSNYTNGYFYKCTSNGLVPPTYSWVQIDVQESVSIATDSTVGTVKPDNETIIIDPDGTIHALGGGGGIHLANVSGATATSNKRVVSLKWSDPPDVVVSGITLAEWAGTKILRKIDSAPTGIDDEDATLIVDSKTRNAYSSTPYEDDTVDYGVQYYYKFFPYTVDELYTSGSAVGIVPEREVIDAIPSQSGRLEYSGEAQSPTWSNYDTDELTIGGTTSGTAVDTYTATFTPKSDYMWDDGTQDAVDVTWAISNITISAVPTQDGTLSYTGESQSPTWNGYDTNELTISGDTSGTEIGTYTATFTPKTNYEWYDGTTTGKTATWKIDEAIITTVPTQQGTLTYDGTEQTAVWNNFNTDELTIANGTGINAGSYTASFTPKSGYKWNDGTTTAKTADFVINKAVGSVTLSTNSVTLDEDHLTATVMTSNATGDISVSINDPSIATVSFANNTITINSQSERGVAVVTVSVASSANYNAATTTINVTGDFLVIKSWKDGQDKATDEELVSMLAAADAGTLDLSLYWAIGDSRTVHLNRIPGTSGDCFYQEIIEQDIELVLMNEGYSGLGNENINYVWGQKNLFKSGVGTYIHPTWSIDMPYFSWDECKIRDELNSKYLNALPETFRSCLKQFNTLTVSSSDTSNTKSSQDYISMFAEKEVYGTRNYSWQSEASTLNQIDYYKTSSNITKYYYIGGSSYRGDWWLRSPMSDNSRPGCFCYSGVSGSTWSTCDAGRTIAPFGCI